MKSVEELERRAEEIERELKLCESDSRRAGALTVKVQSFHNALRKENPSDPKVKRLQTRSKYFITQARLLSEQAAKEQENIDSEMTASRIRPQRSGEIEYDSQGGMSTQSDSEFFSEQSTRMDSFISTTMDSIESLKRQGLVINRINDRLRDGLSRIGMSAELIESVEARFGRDRGIFYILFTGLVLFIVLLFIMF